MVLILIMRNPTSSEDYGDAHQRAFHFVRALCLIALIIVHALSFNNRVLMQTSISSIPGGILFHSLGAMNSLFVFLAGVTFRLQLNPFVTGYRLRPGVFATTARMLFMLLCIDLLKNHLVYNTAAVILSWDFLHTLLLSWCAIWALSRIDIRLNLVAAAAISWFHADLRNYFLRGAWTWAEGWPPLDRWNLFHTYSLVAVALSAVILLVLLWRQPWPRPLRFVLTAALSVIVVSFVKSISYFEPGTFDYEMARNWWRYGLVGDPLN